MPLKLQDRFSSKDDRGILSFLQIIDQKEEISEEEEKSKAIDALNGDIEARNFLIKSQMKNLIYAAYDYSGKGVLSFEDLFCEGSVALLYAVEHFDPNKGRLRTYTQYWVEKFLKAAIKDERNSIYSNFDEDRYDRLSAELKEKLCTETSTDINPFEWLDEVISINQTLTNEADCTIEERIAGNVPTPEDTVVQKELEERILSILSTYKEEDRDIIYRYFGLAGYKKYSVDDLHELYGKTREEVKSILSKTIRNLRNDSRFDDLQEYVQ